MISDASQALLDPLDITDIATRLDSVCLACGGEGCAAEDTACPVLHALYVLTSYLRDGRRVLKPTWGSAEIPGEAWLTTHELQGVADDIADACLGCDQHVPTCFLNIAYEFIEKALAVDDQKPAARRPGDHTAPWAATA